MKSLSKAALAGTLLATTGSSAQSIVEADPSYSVAYLNGGGIYSNSGAPLGELAYDLDYDSSPVVLGSQQLGWVSHPWVHPGVHFAYQVPGSTFSYVWTNDIQLPLMSAARVSIAYANNGTHICATDSNGGLWHGYYDTSAGTFSGFGDIEGQAGERGQFVDVSCAIDSDGLHTFGVTSAGDLYHSIRLPGGAWTAFENVEALSGEGGTFTRVDAAAVSNLGYGSAVHVVAVTQNRRVMHTQRFTNGTWQSGFVDVIGVLGATPFGWVDNAGNVSVRTSGQFFSETLSVLVVGVSGNLTQTTRAGNGAWSSWAPSALFGRSSSY